MTGSTARSRRDALVAGACLGAVVLQAVGPVVIGWAGYGAGAAADAAVVAVSSPVLLGVVAFGIVLGAALDRPGLEPVCSPRRGPVDERGALADHRALGASARSGPVRPGAPPRTFTRRLRWCVLAALVQLAVTAAAIVVDGGVRSGAASLADAIDDGSAAWAVVLLVVQGGFIELRAPVAFGIAWYTLGRASRPVRPEGGCRPRRSPAARTRPRSPGRQAS